MIERLRKEPALITSTVAAAIALAVSFGLHLTGEQTGAIMALVTIIAGIVTRTQVTPTATGTNYLEPADPDPEPEWTGGE